MRRLLLFTLLVLAFSCNNERILLLPEIVNAEITEVHDVSPIYVFYDETKADSLELNRANLITSTNWLVNIDKRLTLGQVIPKIIELQDKKRKAEAKKSEHTKNYFTCNDTSIQNLGFLDFTKVIYKTNFVLPNISPDYENPREKRIIIDFRSPRDIKLVSIFKDSVIVKSSLPNLTADIEALAKDVSYELYLNINDNLSFQDYITFKSTLSKVNFPKMSINENEFIY
ncbi:MAG TPA: hypothetical protein VNJ50_01975 [Gelidibacter sp.]|uniref:hypothetical protein n=1 Tax=Gelidibacter sp. TaxID=2018083 RepID=UPI002C872A0A|nr:hypothetical protein [Gelidibacter sp.]HXJ97589.1 hypothetical protein [Gelidibacter sp.]